MPLDKSHYLKVSTKSCAYTRVWMHEVLPCN